MKVYINKTPVVGPWGGGNKFVTRLYEFLNLQNCQVTDKLSEDVDIIFCFDPRPNKDGLWYQDFINHKLRNNSKIIQRVGDVGTHSKPDLTKLVMQTTKFSDFIIFPSCWAKNFISYAGNNYSIVPNGSHEKMFLNTAPNMINKEKINLVTHHWSDNPMKGFEIYSYVGNLIKEKYDKIYSLTYIGRYNNSYSSSGINIIPPMSIDELSLELPKYDLYITASLAEAGANHVLEAMACNLPVLYRKGGGSINEYCNGMGVEYSEKEEIIGLIDKIKDLRFPNYSRKIEDVIKEYWEIICKVY